MTVLDKLNKVHADIVKYQKNAKLVCVCKTFPVEVYETLASIGERNFAENYVQEAVSKRELFDPKEYQDIQWHYIGAIQSNKIKLICEYFDCIHSLDQLKHAKKISACLSGLNKTINVLVHVNLANEEQKSGIPKQELKDFLHALQDYKNINCIGLMTFPPYQDDPEHNRTYFKQLKKLLESHKDYAPDPERFKELSMGVSNDYYVALQEGATMIRLGSSILGKR